MRKIKKKNINSLLIASFKSTQRKIEKQLTRQIQFETNYEQLMTTDIRLAL